MDANQLKCVLENPAASASQRQAALDALNALADPGDPVQKPDSEEPEAISPLEAELLRFATAPELSQVEYIQIHEFCAEHRWNSECRALWERWVFASPVASARVREMVDYMRKYFLEQYDSLLARFGEVIRKKEDATEIRTEMREFFKDWSTSCVLTDLEKQACATMAAVA